MQGDMTVDRMEVEAVDEILHDKLGRLVELHLMHHLALRASFFTLGRVDASITLLSLTHNLAHTMQTRTLGAEDGVFALFAGFPKGSFEFGTLAVGNVEHTFRFPNLAAAHALHTFREDDLVAGFRHELNDLVDKVVNLAATLRLSHGLIDARGEIYDLQWRVFFLFMWNALLDDELREVGLLWLAMLFRHGGGPKRQAHLVHAAADAGHEGGTEGEVSGVGHIEDYTETTLDASHVFCSKLTNLITCRTLVHIHLTNQVRQFAGVDLHRAGRRTKAVGSAGLVAIVFVLALEGGETVLDSGGGASVYA